MESWAIEAGTPNVLFRRGVTKQSLKSGTEVVVDGYQAKDGTHRANGREVKLADGTQAVPRRIRRHWRAVRDQVISGVPPRRAVALPFAFATALLAFSLLSQIRQNPPLVWSISVAALLLMTWNVGLAVLPARSRRAFSLDIALRRQHYVQACAHSAILLYWGWYWRPVYDAAWLIAAQILFAYAFDMLLTWSRRDVYTLGFGPFPIVFSMNLFLWFRPEWFYWQFAMVAAAFTGKALLQWEKGGRPAHVFNPSALALTVMSLGLLITGASDRHVGT